MADVKDQIEIELDEPEKDAEEPDHELLIEDDEEKAEKPEKIVKNETIDPEDGINDLKNKLLEEQKRRFEAENRAREAVQRQYQAQVENEEANFVLVKSAIDTVRGENDLLKQAYKEALSIGDFDRVAEVQEKLTENRLRLSELEKGHDYMRARREEAQRQPQRAPQPPPPTDPVEALASQLSPRSADWVRRNPQYVTDQRLYKKMVAAHQMAIADDIQPDTDEYFSTVEDILKVKRPVERVERRVERPAEDDDATSEAAKVTQRRAAPPAAPVSRSSGGPGAPRPNVIKLTRAEAEAARDMGMSEKEYWQNKQLLQKEGRI